MIPAKEVTSQAALPDEFTQASRKGRSYSFTSQRLLSLNARLQDARDECIARTDSLLARLWDYAASHFASLSLVIESLSILECAPSPVTAFKLCHLNFRGGSGKFAQHVAELCDDNFLQSAWWLCAANSNVHRCLNCHFLLVAFPLKSMQPPLYLDVQARRT